jgi:TolB-like protein/tetratricopeptide (TPR) repeat protein
LEDGIEESAVQKFSGLLVEMRRRRMFRVTALYFVGAWIILQVADLAFDAWGIPSAALRYVWIGAILGFPVAMIFGWRFDIVGGQIIHTPDSDASAELSLRRSDLLILAALAAVVVATVYGIGVEISSIRSPESDEIVATSVHPASIAILPFSNTGGNEGNADFLALGIQDDLLTRLSKISSLRVTSRTSADRYRNSTKGIRDIGKELGVGKILEGSVQSAGDKIRVNVQLIDAASDEHLWAETYDRNLTASDIFSIQTDIVETIVRQLRASLTTQESSQLATTPTENLAAYTAYLNGRNQADIESIASLNAAIEHFKTAIDLDPDFALAHIGLADAYLTLSASFFGGLPVDESVALAEPPLARALELDANIGEAYATLGLLRKQQGDWQAAENAYEQAIALQPSYSRVFRLYGHLRAEQGRFDDAFAFGRKALTLDPYSAPVNFDLARYLDVSGRFDEAMTRYLRVVDIEPDHAFAYVYIAAIHYLVYGQVDESLIWYHKAAQNDALSPSLQAVPAIACLELGDPDSAREWVDKGMDLGPDTFFSIWTSLLLNFYSGDEEAARRDARTMHELMPRAHGALHFLRNADIAAGRFGVARSRYARIFRELTEPEKPKVDASNYRAAIDLALILIHLGEQERADDLLEGSLKAIESISRLGTEGHWIADVQIFALQQRPQKALDALRLAIDEGWRVLVWFYLDHDPNLDSIRDEPEFERLYAQLRTDFAEQAERVDDLRASGEL